MRPANARQALLSSAVAGVLCLSLTACGTSDDASPSTATPPAAGATTAATTAASATTAAGTPATPAADSRTVSAADLCAFLTKNLPRWKSAGGELAAMTQATTELFTFYDEKGRTVPRTELDDLTRAQCPDVRTEVLKTIGVASFLQL